MILPSLKSLVPVCAIRFKHHDLEEAAEPPEVEQAPVAREKVDPLATVRENAIWWGIAGGGALGLALVLRPLFARRKSSM